MRLLACMSGDKSIESHDYLSLTLPQTSANPQAMIACERKKDIIRYHMEVFAPQAHCFSQRIFRCARLLLQIPNLMVEGNRTQEIQEIIDHAPDSDETMDVTQIITYDATSMMIFIRALKLQDITLRFINKDIYADLTLTDRERKDKHLLAKMMYLKIQNAPNDVL